MPLVAAASVLGVSCLAGARDCGKPPCTSAAATPARGASLASSRSRSAAAREVPQSAGRPAPSAGRRGAAAARSALCAALVDASVDSQPRLEAMPPAGPVGQPRKGVPLWVMLPLDTVSLDGKLHHLKMLEAGLPALKSIGVTGVMFDLWWGMVEAAGPKEYNWSAYVQLVDLVAGYDLKVQAVMSFHACGCNVGDSCTITLPEWVLRVGEKNKDVYYTDRSGKRDEEYLSLGVDDEAIFEGRTPLQIYGDCMQSFVDTFKHRMGSTIQHVAIGLGPAGELRYPSYPEVAGTWRFPGTGEFQNYDKYMMERLRLAAEAEGKPEWGRAGPHDAGGYNGKPDETGFFTDKQGNWESPYGPLRFPPDRAPTFSSGKFFLSWYSDQLINHGDRILGAARVAFRDHGDVLLMAKLPGIHWWFNTRSHAAELVAGMYNSEGTEGYRPIMRMLRRNGCALNFTCAEMLDDEQPRSAKCSPQKLLQQVAQAAADEGVPLAAENALARFDRTAYDTVMRNAFPSGGGGTPQFVSFTYLRKGGGLFHPSNWHQFVRFARRLAQVDDSVEESDQLEALYNVAGDAAMVYHHQHSARR